MSATRRRFGRSSGGFALVELLVVIAIIALLASLLLPALTTAKASARSVKCRSNLRQLAVALNVYVGDYRTFPAFGNWAAAIVWNNPTDPLRTINDFDPGKWPICTERFRWPAQRQTTPGYYWYNMRGVQPPMASIGNEWWGLGLTKNSEPPVLPWGIGIKEAELVAPWDMVVFTDEVVRQDPAQGFTGPPYSGTEYYYPHQNRVGVSFYDGHTECFTRQDFVKAQGATNDFWRRWNRDHLPHPEGWHLP